MKDIIKCFNLALEANGERHGGTFECNLLYHFAIAFPEAREELRKAAVEWCTFDGEANDIAERRFNSVLDGVAVDAKYTPQTVARPGEVITDYLNARCWTKERLEMLTGADIGYIYDVCDGRDSITPEFAKQLEIFGKPAHFWLNLQTNFDTHTSPRES